MASSVVVLYVLVVLSFAAWVLLFTLVMMKRKRPRKGPRWAEKQRIWLKHSKKNHFHC